MPKNKDKAINGFTLTESIITVAITGTLATIALPSYIEQTKKSTQLETEAMVSQVIGQISSFNDEFGKPPENWKDLDKVATISTSKGAATSNNFDWISLPNQQFKLKVNRSGNLYTLLANPTWNAPQTDEDDPHLISAYNIIACLNVATGSSDIRKGNGTIEASTTELTCDK